MKRLVVVFFILIVCLLIGLPSDQLKEDIIPSNSEPEARNVSDAELNLPIQRMVQAFGLNVCSQSVTKKRTSTRNYRKIKKGYTTFQRRIKNYLNNNEISDLAEFLYQGDQVKLANITEKNHCILPVLLPSSYLLEESSMKFLTEVELGSENIYCLNRSQIQSGNFIEPTDFYPFVNNIDNYLENVKSTREISKLNRKVKKLRTSIAKNQDNQRKKRVLNKRLRSTLLKRSSLKMFKKHAQSVAAIFNSICEIAEETESEPDESPSPVTSPDPSVSPDILPSPSASAAPSIVPSSSPNASPSASSSLNPSPSASPSHGINEIGEDVVAYYTFDGVNAQGKIADLSGNNNHLTLVGNPSVSGGKITFTGSNFAYNNSPSSLPALTEERTITTRVRYTIPIRHTVIAGYGDPSSCANFQLGFDYDGSKPINQLELIHYGFNEDCDTKFGQVADLLKGGEHHLALVYDGTQVELYVDGTRIDGVSRDLETNPNVLCIGSEVQGNSCNNGDRRFQGEISEFAIFDRALDGVTIDHLRQGIATPTPSPRPSIAPSPSSSPSSSPSASASASPSASASASSSPSPSASASASPSASASASASASPSASASASASASPSASASQIPSPSSSPSGGGSELGEDVVAHYTFEGLNAQGKVEDLSGENNHLTLVGSPSVSDGKITFTGSNYAFNNSPNSLPINRDHRTMTMRVTYASPVGHTVIAGYGNTSPCSNFQLGFDYQPGTPVNQLELMYYGYTGNCDAKFGQNASLLNDGEHHLALVYDGNQVEFYVDGDRKGGVSRALQTNPNVLCLGSEIDGNACNNGSNGDRRFQGEISEFTIFNRALDQTTIDHLIQGLPTPIPSPSPSFVPPSPSPNPSSGPPASPAPKASPNINPGTAQVVHVKNTSNQASCNANDINRTIDSIKDGPHQHYEIRVPNKNCTWRETVIIDVDKSITLKGAGVGNTRITDEIPNVQDLVNHKVKRTLIRIDTKPNRFMRVTGFEFLKGSGDKVNGGYAIQLNGTAEDGHFVRIDHNKFDRLIHRSNIELRNTVGVSDSNIGIYDQAKYHLFGFYPRWPDMQYYQGHGPWAEDADWGSHRFFFIEDNCLDQSVIDTGNGYSIIDGNEGVRLVFRHNDAVNTGVTFHGTEREGKWRGSRAAEIYNNNFWKLNKPGQLMSMRSGNVLFYGNEVEDLKGLFRGLVKTIVHRLWRQFEGYTTMATGYNPFDQNDTQNNPHVSGTATNGGKHRDLHNAPFRTMTDTSKSWVGGVKEEGKTVKEGQWSGYSLYSPHYNRSWLITGNTTNTLYLQEDQYDQDHPVLGHGTHQERAYHIVRVLRGADQVGLGRGKGKNLSDPSDLDWFTEFPDPMTNPMQEHEGSYAWNNRHFKLSGKGSGDVIKGGIGGYYGLIENDIDFFNHNHDFDGSSGIGVGLFHNRPSCSKRGVGYWATDRGANGTLYVCNTSNQWVEHYKPYMYPHPGRQGDSGKHPAAHCKNFKPAE